MGHESYNYNRPVSILRQIVGIESHTPEGRASMADFTVSCLQEELKCEVRKVVYPTGSNVYAYVGHRDPKYVDQNTLLTWHLDSVRPHRAFAEQGIDPYELRPCANRPHVFKGLKAGDLGYAQIGRAHV